MIMDCPSCALDGRHTPDCEHPPTSRNRLAALRDQQAELTQQAQVARAVIQRAVEAGDLAAEVEARTALFEILRDIARVASERSFRHAFPSAS